MLPGDARGQGGRLVPPRPRAVLEDAVLEDGERDGHGAIHNRELLAHEVADVLLLRGREEVVALGLPRAAHGVHARGEGEGAAELHHLSVRGGVGVHFELVHRLEMLPEDGIMAVARGLDDPGHYVRLIREELGQGRLLPALSRSKLKARHFLPLLLAAKLEDAILVGDEGDGGDAVVRGHLEAQELALVELAHALDKLPALLLPDLAQDVHTGRRGEDRGLLHNHTIDGVVVEALDDARRLVVDPEYDVRCIA
mmetsp:Transcript_24662/g.72539  ORF Transcript_24662/g.72539 Transcript_24662/m.72539 type:complete len:254 (-) Transcript_24662:139-900(-)